jgi:hypothetical protein
LICDDWERTILQRADDLTHASHKNCHPQRIQIIRIANDLAKSRDPFPRHHWMSGIHRRFESWKIQGELMSPAALWKSGASAPRKILETKRALAPVHNRNLAIIA